MYLNRVLARFSLFVVSVLVVAIAVLQSAPWLPRELALISGFVAAACVFSRSARRVFSHFVCELADVLVSIAGLLLVAARSFKAKAAPTPARASAKADVASPAQPIYNPIPSGTWAAEKAAADAERQAWLTALESQGVRRERAMSVLRAAMSR